MIKKLKAPYYYDRDVIEDVADENRDKLNEIIDHLNSESSEKPEWQEGDEMWYVAGNGKVNNTFYTNDEFAQNRLKFGNIFHTEKEAIEAREVIKKALYKFKKEGCRTKE